MLINDKEKVTFTWITKTDWSLNLLHDNWKMEVDGKVDELLC